MAYDPAEYTYEDWLLDTDDGIERCAHGIDVDSPCEDCSPESIPPGFTPYRWRV